MTDSEVGALGAGDLFTQALSPDPGQFRELIRTHPQTERLRWWRAVPNPSYIESRGDTSEGQPGGQYTYVEQVGDWFALVTGGERVMRRFMQSGTWQSGDITLTFDPDVLDLGPWDRVLPLGRMGATGSQASAAATHTGLSGRTQVAKQTLVRGGYAVPGAGTVAVSDSSGALVGTGTQFTQFLVVGDVVSLLGQLRRITAIGSDTTATVDAALPATITGAVYSKMVDRLLFGPAVQVTAVADGNGIAYTPGVHFNLAPDTTLAAGMPSSLIQWISGAQPAAGAGYGIVYKYLPTYQMMDLGTTRPIIAGSSLPRTLVARLWIPEQNY